MTSKPFFEMTLPLPPSVNNYWGYRAVSAKGRLFVQMYLLPKAKTYRQEIRLLTRLVAKNYSGKVKAEFVLHYKDNRKNDLDNRIKALQDALTHAEVIADDSLIDEFTAKRGDNIKGGQVVVKLWAIE